MPRSRAPTSPVPRLALRAVHPGRARPDFDGRPGRQTLALRAQRRDRLHAGAHGGLLRRSALTEPLQFYDGAQFRSSVRCVISVIIMIVLLLLVLIVVLLRGLVLL